MPLAPDSAKLAITDVTLLTLDRARRIIPQGCLIVENGRIRALGRQEELRAEIAAIDGRIDGRGMVAMPGLVNAHTHAFQSLLRGLAEGMDLLAFLRDLIYPVARVISDAQIRVAAELSVVEAVKSGTTCLIDNQSVNTSLRACEEVLQVFRRSGIRGVLARGFRLPTPRARAWGVPGHVFEYALAEELEITRHLMEGCRRWIEGRVRVCPAPLTLFLAGESDLRAAKALADEYQAPLHIHVAETRSEVEATLADHGCREVEYLARLGMLDARMHVVHGVWLDDHELDLVAQAGAHIIHNPTSNMSLGSGIAPVPAMLQRGINVALGSDGIGNFNHDMMAVMKATPLMHRAHMGRADVMAPEQVIEMATLGGARALGLQEEIGSLEVGKQADVILIDMRKPHLVPCSHIPAAIVNGANAADVDTVIVGGRVIMQGRRVMTLDEEKVIAEALAAGHELLGQAGLLRGDGRQRGDRSPGAKGGHEIQAHMRNIKGSD